MFKQLMNWRWPWNAKSLDGFEPISDLTLAIAFATLANERKKRIALLEAEAVCLKARIYNMKIALSSAYGKFTYPKEHM